MPKPTKEQRNFTASNFDPEDTEDTRSLIQKNRRLLSDFSCLPSDEWREGWGIKKSVNRQNDRDKYIPEGFRS